MNSNSNVLTALGLSVVLSMVSSCTLNEGDPQTTICQKLTAHLMKAEGVQWKETSKSAGADNSMKVTVRWDSVDATGTLPMQASCLYLSNEDDAGEDFDVNVDKEYQGVPASMTINGQTVRPQDLYMAIHKVTGQSVKDTANEEHLRKKAAEAGELVKEGAANASQAIHEGAAQVKEKAGVAAKAIKEGTEQFRQKAGDVLKKAGEQLQK